MLFEGDWTMDSRFRIDADCCKKIINPYDESALEVALKLRDSALGMEKELTLSALTIGGADSEKTLKNLCALKYDRAVRIECGEDLRFRPQLICDLIANYLLNIEPHQVVIMGEQNSEGNNAKTPLLVAEKLGIPCIAAVEKITLSKVDGCLDITSRTEESVTVQTLRPPVVLSVGNVADSFLRVPTLKDKMNAAKKEIEVLSSDDPRLSPAQTPEEDCELIALFEEKKTRSCAMITGEARQQAQTLWGRTLRERVRR